tara:strand:- start:43 stop:438 length:396 start_codon:yes stop_codon:yes gene_type:complete
MNKIKIQVKEKHIKDGIPENCTYCAVALAIDETLRNMFKLDFEPRIVERGNTDYALRLADNKPSPYQTEFNTQISMEDQETVNDFVYDFDQNRDVDPFEFNIEFTDTIIAKMRNLEKQEKKLFDDWENKKK